MGKNRLRLLCASVTVFSVFAPEMLRPQCSFAAEPLETRLENKLLIPINYAPPDSQARRQKKMEVMRKYLLKMKSSMAQADQYSLAEDGGEDNLLAENILPEGEMLLLQPMLRPNIRLEGLIAGRVHQRKVVLSLKDFVSLLQFSITVEDSGKRAVGWFIRENNIFELDTEKKHVRAGNKTFDVRQNFLLEDGDILVSSEDLAQWFEMELDLDISTQEIEITAGQNLPILERYARRKMLFSQSKRPLPELPLGGEGYQALDAPFVDVATNSTYARDGEDADVRKRHTANIRTSGDFAYGTLLTQTQVNNADQVSNVRVNYQRESDKPELLGALKARKVEIGDVATTRVPLAGSLTQELGARVTNLDPFRGSVRPTTTITGQAISGWDVELYRDTQFVGFQEVSEDGTYQFNDVTLFEADNDFKLVFYGPQGERYEEEVHVPVDASRLAESGGVYDVSLSMNDKQTYQKDTGNAEDEDAGTPSLAAIYEHSLGGVTAGSIGVKSQEIEGARDSTLTLGVSTVALESLLNADMAVDDEGDLAAELALRRSFGKHDFSNTITWNAPHFDNQIDNSEDQEGYIKNNFNLVGDLPFAEQSRPRYNFNTTYIKTTDEAENLSLSGGLSGSYKGISLSEQLTYSNASHDPDDRLNAVTNVNASHGRNRVRLAADYAIKPESELTRVLANYHRSLSRELDFELEAERRLTQDLTEYNARLDWQAGFMRISPRVSYNSENDFFAGLNTRMGLLRDPHGGKIKAYDRLLTTNGGVSAFVFLDKDGNGIFDGQDEPLPEVIVQSVQNGGRKTTDENGIALFNRMRELKLTDIKIDPETLQDPSWVPGFKGASILPRQGYIASLDFPVHIAGEIDGVVAFADNPDKILRNVSLSLYNAKGEVEQTSVTDATGFYYFSRVPPGRYLLIIDEISARAEDFIRPEPQAIEIGYSGTNLYANNLKVKSGTSDVPSEIRPNMDAFKKMHPHIDFTQGDYEVVLNLGEYNSSLMMSVILYKLRTRFEDTLQGADIFVPPTQSYADVKTGKHTLRVGLESGDIHDAYRRCRSLMAQDQYCKVEIYPAYMKQAKVDVSVSDNQ